MFTTLKCQKCLNSVLTQVQHNSYLDERSLPISTLSNDSNAINTLQIYLMNDGITGLYRHASVAFISMEIVSVAKACDSLSMCSQFVTLATVVGWKLISLT